MLKGTRVNSLPTWLKGRFLFLSTWLSTVRSRKVYFGLCVLLILFLFWSVKQYVHFNKFKSHRAVILADHAEACLNTLTSQWNKAIFEGDAVLFHQTLQGSEQYYLPFTANGQIGVTVGDGKEHIFVADRDGLLTVEVPFSPIIVPKIHGITPKEATLIHFKEGIVYKLWGYSADRSCITIQQKVFAHRSHKSLLVQEIVVSNRKMIPLRVTFKHTGAEEWEESVSKSYSFEGDNSASKTFYSQINGPVKDQANFDGSGVVVAMSRFPSDITVPMHNAKTLHHFSVIAPMEGPANTSPLPSPSPAVMESSKKNLQKYHDNPNQVVLLHVAQWNKLWQTGIYVDSHNDPDTPTSTQVNGTLYYVLSSVPYEADPTAIKEDITNNKTRENCYNGHPTMHLAVLWKLPKTELAVANLLTVWKSKLVEFQCSSYLNEGAKGLLQAMVLSFGGLEFIEKRLEFAANPASLQNNLTFRHVECYGNYLDLHVTINHYTRNAESIYINLESIFDIPLYACGGGCQHDPVQLSGDVAVFPVKLTSPVTPLLYIAANKSNLLELKQHIFSKNVQHLSHPHHLEYHHVGLPVKFWVSIALLIVGFHLYLAKLVYQECFRDFAGKPKGAIS